MKKIIYSLVIMIAAGSLFTSCIEPVEPAGIYDLREAKARYYDALSKLRAADALLVEAKADLEKANAEYRRAQVENQNLQNEYQRLLNEAKQLDNEKEAAKWAMEIEELQKQHELEMIKYQGKIAQAQEKLRQILSEIEMAALDLTEAEKEALADAIKEYEDAYAKYLKAVAAVTKAEAELWDLQYAYNNQYDGEGIYFDQMYEDEDGNLHYYGEDIRTGQDLVEYYESCVEYYTFYAAYFAAMYEEMAENSDIAKWAEELEELKADLAEREYNRYQVTKDSVEYMQNVFHDGNIEFGLEVAAWIEDNPAVAEPKKPTEPKESSYKPADYMKDSIAFDVLEYTAPNQAFDKFRSLISKYEGITSLVTDTSSYKVITVDPTEKTITLIANQEMKDFVLGTETSTVNSQVLKYYDKATETNVEVKADYGLIGALSVLERDLVLKGKDGKTPEELAKELKEAKENWEADRDTLMKFFDAVEKAEAAKKGNPYEAYEPIAKAMKAYNEAKEADAKGQSGMVAASKTLIEVLNGIVSHADLSTPDSTELVKAIVAFATAREQYLTYKPYKNSPRDSNKIYYVYSTSPDVLVDSSLNFKDLTLDYIRKHPSMKYNWTGGTTYADLSESGAVKGAAFRTILTQLVGATIADRIKTPATSTETDLNTTAFYDAYQYAATDPAEIEDLAGNKYEDPAVAKAEDAFEAAVDAFNDLWVRYWNVTPVVLPGEVLAANFDDFKAAAWGADFDPAVYTIETFTEPYNCVAFDEDGETILPTAAIQVILASVDPYADPADFQGTNFNPIKTTSAIFNNYQTDFYKYMKAAWAADNTDTQMAIDKIDEWIDGVIAAFEKNVTDAEAAAKKAYEDAKAKYEKDMKTYETNKAKYDAYMTALKAFVGVDEKGNPINVAKNTAGAYVPAVVSIAAPTNYQSVNVKQTQTGAFEWEGEWKLGGTQKELAEKYMPGYPEKLAAWRSTAKENEDEIGHLKAIIDALEKAYMAAIAVDDPKGAAAAKKQVEVYFENYLDYLESMVEYCLANISWYEDAIAKAEAGYDDLQIEIEVAELKLAYAQQKLQDATIELEVAEAYYNKVLTAILGKN